MIIIAAILIVITLYVAFKLARRRKPEIYMEDMYLDSDYQWKRTDRRI